VVLEALRKCDLPESEVITWCTVMLESDRVGFIAREPLQSLRNHPQTTAAPWPSGRLPTASENG
jgi:hypothetical protein